MSLDISPTTQDAMSVILQNYNARVGLDAQLNDIDYSYSPAAQAAQSSDAADTILVATPLVVSPTKGKVTIRYRRMNLSVLNSITPVVRGNAQMISDLIPQINELYGINLVDEDYDNEIVPANSPAFTFFIKPTSLLFIGMVTVSIVTEEVPVATTLSWLAGADPEQIYSPNRYPTIKINGVLDPAATYEWFVDWTESTDGGAPPTVSATEDFTVAQVAVQDSPTGAAMSSGVGVISLKINGVLVNNTLVIVVSDTEQLAYEAVGTYLTLADTPLAAGTLISEACYGNEGFDLWGTFADGLGRTYTKPTLQNSAQCGYTGTAAIGWLTPQVITDSYFSGNPPQAQYTGPRVGGEVFVWSIDWTPAANDTDAPIISLNEDGSIATLTILSGAGGLSSGVGVLSLTVDDVVVGNTLVMVVSDEQSGGYEGVGTYLTLEEVPVQTVIYIKDTFEGSSTLLAHTGEIGAEWSQWNEAEAQVFKVENNRMRLLTFAESPELSTNGALAYPSGLLPDAGKIEFTLTAGSDQTNWSVNLNESHFVEVHMGEPQYASFLEISGYNYFHLGIKPPYPNTDFVFTPGQDYTFRIVYSALDASMFIDGTLVKTTTLSNSLEGKKLGIELYSNGDAVADTPKIGNLLVTN